MPVDHLVGVRGLGGEGWGWGGGEDQIGWGH